VNRFVSLARARQPVVTLDRATGGDRGSSARYRDILAPLGLGDELRVALRTSSRTWGFMCLHRQGPTGFSASELNAIKRIAPHAGEAIRRIVAQAIAAPPGCAGQSAVLVVERDRIAGMTEPAAGWLEALAGTQIDVDFPLPTMLLALVRRLEALERGDSAAPARVRLTTSRGVLLDVQASRLRGHDRDGAIVVTLVPADAHARSSLMLAAHGLTAAQCRIAELVLQGLATREITSELRISEYTVQDHLKAVFEKLGVASRRELVAMLLASSR
jgi:DNA-binding CsgD family transcriptional regulator